MGIVIVYDVSDEKSFDNIPTWLTNIDQHATDDAVKVLIGNKCDVTERRVVSYQQGKELADQYGLQFFETSAKLNHNVDAVFHRLANEIKVKIDEMNKKNGLSRLSFGNSYHNAHHSKGVNMHGNGTSKLANGTAVKTNKCCLIA